MSVLIEEVRSSAFVPISLGRAARRASWVQSSAVHQLAALSLAFAFGCAGLDPATDSCATVPNCGTRATQAQTLDATGADWSCLNAPPSMPPQMAPGTMLTYELPIVDWVDSSPLDGLTIFKCATIDSSCTTPLATFLPPDGRKERDVPVQLEAGFTGFLNIVSSSGIGTLPNGMPDTSNAYVPEAYYFGNTIYSNRTVKTIIQVLRQPILTQVAKNIGVQLDFTQALLVLRVLDCAGNPAAGVKFSIDKPGVPYTLIQGLPQLPADPSDFVPTDANGQAGFANVAPGYVFVSAYLDDAAKTPINRTAASATALAGQLTVVEVQARPFGVAPSSTP